MVYLMIIEGKNLKIIHEEKMKQSYTIAGKEYICVKEAFYVRGEPCYVFMHDNPYSLIIDIEENREKLKKAVFKYFNKEYKIDSELAYSLINSERLKRIYSYKTSLIKMSVWVILFSIIAFMLGLIIEFKFPILG